jgi:hypothetical protein
VLHSNLTNVCKCGWYCESDHTITYDEFATEIHNISFTDDLNHVIPGLSATDPLLFAGTGGYHQWRTAGCLTFTEEAASEEFVRSPVQVPWSSIWSPINATRHPSATNHKKELPDPVYRQFHAAIHN